MFTRSVAAVLVLLAVVQSGCGKKVSDNERLNAAVAEFRKGEIGKCSEYLDAVLKNNPENCSARLMQALVFEKNGDYDKALDMASKVAIEYPDSFAALYTRGRLLAKSRPHRRLAFETLEAAYKLNPDDVSNLILLCNLGTELKHGGVSVYIEQLRKNPEYTKNNQLNYMMGKALMLKGEHDKATDYLFAAIENNSDPELCFYIARLIDESKRNPHLAKNLYHAYIMFPGSNKSPALINYAQNRMRWLGR